MPTNVLPEGYHWSPQHIADQQMPGGKPWAPVQIGPHTFYINPWEFNQQEKRIFFKQLTKGGITRLSYTTDTIVYTFVGFYGNAGTDELDASEAWRPTFANKKELSYLFSFPLVGIAAHPVFVNDYRVNITRDMPNYLQYTFTLEEYPPAQSIGYTSTALTQTTAAAPNNPART